MIPLKKSGYVIGMFLVVVTSFLHCKRMDQKTLQVDSRGTREILISLEGDEKIWSGVIKEGHLMPFEGRHSFDFYANNMANQLQPLLMSNRGLYVWSEEPFSYELRENHLYVKDPYDKVIFGRQGHSLKEVRRFVADSFFAPSGKVPDPELFLNPQYNTWIELTYNQNQADILTYAHSIIKQGFPPGVLMIDDTWQEDYGLWDFHPGRFPDPEAMMDELHALGFKVMLWICPFVSPDQTLIIKELAGDSALLMHHEADQRTGNVATFPAMIPWWNGTSALLDFTSPLAVDWFKAQLEYLVKRYQVDGFKFDAGDMEFYPPHAISREKVTPNRHCELYAQFGLGYPLNEYRACWKMAGQPLAQRLHDKNHNWEDLGKLIPHMIAEGLAGYVFCCPDMIGGGEYKSFLNLESYDQELVVRSAQCHALMPMMQFSVAPWRILDEDHLTAVKKAVELRLEFTPLIMELVKQAALSGDPIVTNLEFHYPNQGMHGVKDQFMLGGDILVAPMLEKGHSRKVILPDGLWQSFDGNTLKGPTIIQQQVDLETIPYYIRVKENQSL